MTPLATDTNTLGLAIPVGPRGTRSYGVAVTPDGTSAYVTDLDTGTVTPIAVATNPAGKPIYVGGRPRGSPSRRTAAPPMSRARSVTPITLATGSPQAAIPVAAGAIAITPDGTTAYAIGLSGITPIAFPSGTPGAPIPVLGQAIAITPNGATAYVANASGRAVTPIALPAGTPQTPISVHSGGGLAITPDAGTAYVSTCSPGGTVTPISLATRRAMAPITFANGTTPCALAITPDGRTAYVLVGHFAPLGAVAPITMATNTVGEAITLVNRSPVAIAIAGLLRRQTSTAVSCTPADLALGQSTTCTATVTDTDSGSALTPTGTVKFGAQNHGQFSSKTCSLTGSGGAASCQVSYAPTGLFGGLHTVRADYLGDGSHVFSTGRTTVAVSLGATSTNVACSPSALVLNQPAQCTATVTATYAGAPVTPTGKVSFGPLQGGTFTPSTCTLSGSGAVASCQATYTASAVTPERALRATYHGDATHHGSSGDTAVSVARRATTAGLSCDQSTVVAGGSTPCTVMISDASPGQPLTPTGPVTFSGGRNDSFAPSSCMLSGSNGVASCRVSYSAAAASVAGTHTITASYAGDGSDAASRSSTALTIVPSRPTLDASRGGRGSTTLRT